MTTQYEYYPVDDRILVQQRPVEELSAGGIVVSTGKEKAFMGDVLAVGPGQRVEKDGSWVRMPMTIKVGDVVVFGKYAGQETRLNDDNLLVMKEADIIAIATRKEAACAQGV